MVSGPDGFPDVTYAGQHLYLEIEYLLDHGRGDRVLPIAGAYQQGLGDCQGERQVQAEGRSLARVRQHFNAAAQAAHFALQYIHADATPGET